MNQARTAPSAISHISFYPSANMIAPLRGLEANINYDTAAMRHMPTTNNAKASQIDRQHIHTVEGNNGTDKAKEER